jgi:hypothetical protein
MFAFSTLADELSFFSPIAGSNPGITVAGVPSAGVMHSQLSPTKAVCASTFAA